MLTWPTKDPDEVLDYYFDWADDEDPRLETGETISTSAWTVAEGDVEIDSNSHTDTVTLVWLSGGTSGTTCVLTNLITTSASRTYEFSVRLRIRSTVR